MTDEFSLKPDLCYSTLSVRPAIGADGEGTLYRQGSGQDIAVEVFNA